jgi:hypothetical protein
MRGPVSLCAYMGIPKSHPLAGFSYKDIPLRVHGGLTFSSEGTGNYPSDYYWYGWDYAHCDDYSFYNDKGINGRKWLIPDVERETKEAVYDFSMLVKLAEKIVGQKYIIAKASK